MLWEISSSEVVFVGIVCKLPLWIPSETVINKTANCVWSKVWRLSRNYKNGLSAIRKLIEETIKMSDSDYDSDGFTNTPPDVCEMAELATLDLLPTKSRKLYEQCDDKFMKWRADNKAISLSERVFMAHSNKLSKQYEPNRVWSQHSMLKATLRINHQVEIAQYH